MLEALALWSRQQGAQWLWLEVRVSNVRALAIYEHNGFRRVGERKNYYPAVRRPARGRHRHEPEAVTLQTRCTPPWRCCARWGCACCRRSRRRARRIRSVPAAVAGDRPAARCMRPIQPPAPVAGGNWSPPARRAADLVDPGLGRAGGRGPRLAARRRRCAGSRVRRGAAARRLDGDRRCAGRRAKDLQGEPFIGQAGQLAGQHAARDRPGPRARRLHRRPCSSAARRATAIPSRTNSASGSPSCAARWRCCSRGCCW